MRDSNSGAGLEAEKTDITLRTQIQPRFNPVNPDDSIRFREPRFNPGFTRFNPGSDLEPSLNPRSTQFRKVDAGLNLGKPALKLGLQPDFKSGSGLISGLDKKSRLV